MANKPTNKDARSSSATVAETASIEKSLPIWKERLEIVTKVALVTIGTAYVAGLLILNTYLRRYGVNYLNFLQLEYVMVGLLWMFLVLAFTVTTFYVIYTFRAAFFEEGTTDRTIRLFLRKLSPGLGALFAFLSFLWFALHALSDYQLELFTKAGLLASLALLANSAAVMLLFRGVLGIFEAERHVKVNPGPHNDAVYWSKYYQLFYFAVTFFVALPLYSWYVFPQLSPVIGGARPQSVEFIIKSDNIEDLRFSGFEVLPESHSIGVQRVIFEGESFFLVASPTENEKQIAAIRISKEQIQTTLHLVKERPLPIQ
jgi:hypothetical protein